MSEESEVHLNQEISNHFKLLKKGTILFGSIISLTLIPLLGFMLQVRIEQTRMQKDFIQKEEVYDNFVNKGQYIYLQGEEMESHMRIIKGADPAAELKAAGARIKEVLDIRYRGER